MEVRRIHHELDTVRKNNQSLKGTLDMTSATNDNLLETTRALRAQEEVRTKKFGDLKALKASLFSYLKEEVDRLRAGRKSVIQSTADKVKAVEDALRSRYALRIQKLKDRMERAKELNRLSSLASQVQYSLKQMEKVEKA